MLVFKLVITLLLVGAVLAARALLPNLPEVALDPELALTLLVAPVLLDAAFDSSPRDLRHNWRAVTGLALAAVGLTVVAVALVARWLVPGIPWPAAIALGAVVAPPDAAAATAVLAQERHRLSDLRSHGVIGDDASHRVEEELDWAEVNAESRPQ